MLESVSVEVSTIGTTGRNNSGSGLAQTANEQNEQVAHSTAKHKRISFATMGQIIGSKWKLLDKASRRPFEEEAQKEKALYSKKLAAWRSRQTDDHKRGGWPKNPDKLVEDDEECGENKEGNSSDTDINMTSNKTCSKKSQSAKQSLEAEEQKGENAGILHHSTSNKQKATSLLDDGALLSYQPMTNFINVGSAYNINTNLSWQLQHRETDLIILRLLERQAQPSSKLLSCQTLNVKPPALNNHCSTNNENNNYYSSLLQQTKELLNHPYLQTTHTTTNATSCGSGGVPFYFV